MTAGFFMSCSGFFMTKRSGIAQRQVWRRAGKKRRLAPTFQKQNHPVPAVRASV